MYHHNIKPSAPPLPNNDDYINQSIDRYINLSQHLSKDKCSFLNIN